MKVCLKECVGKSAVYELSVEQDKLCLVNEADSLELRYQDMERFWFRRFGARVVAFVIEMTGMVYEGNFLKASDAKRFTQQLNENAGDIMEVTFNINQRSDRRYVL